jgi:hypothetical protein
MTLQAIRSLLVFTRPYPWAIPVLVLLGLAASLAEGLGIGLIIPLLDHMLQHTRRGRFVRAARRSMLRGVAALSLAAIACCSC